MSADTSAVVERIAQAEATTVIVPSAVVVCLTTPVAEPIAVNVIKSTPPAETVILSEVAPEPCAKIKHLASRFYTPVGRTKDWFPVPPAGNLKVRLNCTGLRLL